jgi:iron complex outermembrane recepter protein
MGFKIYRFRLSHTLIFFLILCTFSLQAQNALPKNDIEIKGKILNENSNPVAFATVALIDLDSIPVNGEISDETGDFVIAGKVSGTYRLMVQHLEFETYYSEAIQLTPDKKIVYADIVLKSASVKLDEVVVTGRKAMIEIQADKIVFNVSSSPSASGTNGLDLLRKSPGVMVDMDNNISLLGKGGVQIYINGIQSRLAGNDLATMLQSMTSDNIESIEIISNPSAKYDAEGNAGIINIKLKKNVSIGFNGNITSSASKGNFYRNSNTLVLNYGGEKVKSTFELNRSQEDNQDDFSDIKEQNAFVLKLNSIEIRKRQGYNMALGLDVQLTKNHTLSFSGRGIFNQNENNLNSTTDIFDTNPLRLNQILSSGTFAKMPSQNLNFNLNHRWEIDNSSGFSSDISYGKFTTERHTRQPNTFFGSDGLTPMAVSNNEFDADTYINLWSAKADYEKNWDYITLSTGIKYASIDTDNNFAFYKVGNSGPVLDISKSNDFTYSENVAAAYLIANAKLGQMMKLNIGLRMEHTSSRGQLISDQLINDKDVIRDYKDFFPNVGLSYNDQKMHSWSLSLGRRITRPNYQDLNPFESPLSELSAWKGNPFLRPNYIMNYQLSYAYKQKLTITNSYSVTKDFFATIFEISGEKGQILIPRNMEKATNYGLSISYPLEVSKFWDFIVFADGAYRTFRGDLEGTVIDLTATTYNFRIQNNIKLPWGINMDVTYNKFSDWIWRGSVRVKGNQGLAFGIRKEFFNKKLQVRITGADIFRTDSDYFYVGDYGGIFVDGVRTFDNQRFGVGATWKFGNQKAKVRKKSASAMDEELNRLQGSN